MGAHVGLLRQWRLRCSQVLPVDSGGVLITFSFNSKAAGTFVAFVDDAGELKWAKTFNRANVTLLPIIEWEGRPKRD